MLYSMSVSFTLDASGMFLCYRRNGDTLGFQNSLFLGPCNISEPFEPPGSKSKSGKQVKGMYWAWLNGVEGQ